MVTVLVAFLVLVVTREAVRRGVILPVAVHAIPHLQVSHLLHHLHTADVTVARGAVNAGAYVGFVEELDVVGNAVDSFPLDGLIILKVISEKFKFFALGKYELFVTQVFVAEDALFHGGYASRATGVDGAVTEHALDADFFDVNVVGEVDWLLWGCAHAEYLERF